MIDARESNFSNGGKNEKTALPSPLLGRVDQEKEEK